MFIQDKKYKDYYDFVFHKYPDKTSVWERKIQNISFEDFLLKCLKHPYWGKLCNTRYICLEIGQVQYNIKVHELKYKKNPEYPTVSEYETVPYDATLTLIKKFTEQTKLFKAPIAIGYFTLNRRKFGGYSLFTEDHNAYIEKASSLNELDIEKYKPDLNLNNAIIENPLLKNLHIAPLIPPLEVYQNLDNYFSFLKGDKARPNISNGGPNDIEKAVNHGFDSRFSFRHPVKI
jgi:hypothetical protein